jgi:cell division transport system ATP-binding protein
VIRFDNVSKTYPKQNRPALDNVSLEIEKGEFVFLVGSSGSGKSTFLRLILREERPSTGDVHVLGKDLAKLSNWKVPQMRRQLGTVFQDFRLLPNKTVGQNVAFALEVIGKPRSVIGKVVPEVLELVGLAGKQDRMPGELSGGEQQRVAIARAFVTRPAVLFADEPTGNLDTATGTRVGELLFELNTSAHTTLVLVTHDRELAARCGRMVRMEGGRSL